MSESNRRSLSSLKLRWAILAFSCLSLTGQYYSLDIPAALHQQLKDFMKTKNADPTSSSGGDGFAVKFNLLYSCYSLPNIILPFFGGAIVDTLGAHISFLIFTSFTLLGQIIFAIGTSNRNWTLMLIGRTVYGFGGESVSVASSSLISRWFQGKELALSFGINLAVSRMGSVMNNWITPALANHSSSWWLGKKTGPPAAAWFGVFVNTAAVLCGFAIIYLTQRGEKQCQLRSGNIDDAIHPSPNDMLTEALLLDSEERQEDEALQIHSETQEDMNHDEEREQEQELQEQEEDDNDDEEELCELLQDSSDDSSAETVERSNRNRNRDRSTNGTVEFYEDEEIDLTMLEIPCLTKLKRFGPMFWIVSLSCVLVYGCVLPFNNIASGVLLERDYFTPPPSDCTLKYPTQCTAGPLAPVDNNGDGNDDDNSNSTNKDGGSNPSTDTNGNICPMNRHNRPILPTSIHISFNDTNTDTDENSKSLPSNKWDFESYDYDNLTPADIDCGDQFWLDCTLDFCTAQSHATALSAKVMSIPYFISATLSPFCGYIVDRIGFRAVIASMASVILIGVHLALGLSTMSPVYPLIGQGMAYVCYASVIWPSVPLIVSEEFTGLAFGAIVAIQNIGLALFPLIIAFIYTESDSYIPNVEFFFVTCAAIGTVVGLLLNYFDWRTGGVLNKA